jgi:hypothetical protein
MTQVTAQMSMSLDGFYAGPILCGHRAPFRGSVRGRRVAGYQLLRTWALSKALQVESAG